MIPENKKGDFRIFYRDKKPVLVQGKYEWMNLDPKELACHQKAIDNCFGTVFVGGLGLGYIVEQLEKSHQVKRMIVVEYYQEVIDLVWPHIAHSKADIVMGDAYEVLEATKGLDCVYGDLWDTNPHQEPLKERFRHIAQTKVENENIFLYGETKDGKTKTDISTTHQS
jgi:hypothetical protein